MRSPPRPRSSVPSGSDDDLRTLPRLFLDAARRNWGRLAMADSTGRRLSFGEALAGAMLLRRLILNECPDAEQERMIGLLLPPSVPAALVNVGIGMAGRIPVNLNYTASLDSLEVSVRRCSIRTIFTARKLVERLSLPTTLAGARLVMMEDVARTMSRARQAYYFMAAHLMPRSLLARWITPPDINATSLATVIFSSGSVGAPKGVMLSHRNIIANLEASSGRFTSPGTTASSAFCRCFMPSASPWDSGCPWPLGSAWCSTRTRSKRVPSASSAGNIALRYSSLHRPSPGNTSGAHPPKTSRHCASRSWARRR